MVLYRFTANKYSSPITNYLNSALLKYLHIISIDNPKISRVQSPGLIQGIVLKSYCCTQEETHTLFTLQSILIFKSNLK